MELIFNKSESTVRPVEIEKSKHTVFIRQNFVEEERTDRNENVYTMWVYEEAKLTHKEFEEYSSFIAAKNAINGVNDSSNIVSLLNGQENGDNNQLTIMEALADIYETIATMM